MLKIKKDKIIANGLEKDLLNVNVINLTRNYLSFSSNIADCIPYEQDINAFYQQMLDSGIKGILLLENNIVNINNIVSLNIEYYQYAGISIHKSTKENAELYNLNLVCKNGKTETIPFRTFKEAEQCYHAIDAALTELRNNEAAEKLLNQ